MIRYHRNSWWSQVFVYRGGILVRLFKPGLIYFSYCALCYFAECLLGWATPIDDTAESMHFFGGFVSFLLIFRLNQCYQRYECAIQLTTKYFNTLISILDLSAGYLRAGAFKHELQPGEKPVEVMDLCRAEIVKVNITRLVLAMGASLPFHCRISENAITGGQLGSETVPLVLFLYLRLRGLLLPWERALLHATWGLYHEDNAEDSDDASEGEQDDNMFSSTEDNSFSARLTYREHYHNGRKQSSLGVALPIVLMQLLRKQFKQGLNHNWGYAERILNVMETKLIVVSECFEDMDRLVTIPLPLGYLQHCKVCFLLFVLIYPNTIETLDGFWANVISPCLLFCALSGFEILADQLENPLGDDDVDINLFEMVHTLEVRAKVLFDTSFASESQMWEQSFNMMLKHGRCLPDMKSICNMLDENEMQERTPCCFEDHFYWLRLPPQVLEYLDSKEHGIRRSGLGRRALALWRSLRDVPFIGSAISCCPNLTGNFLPISEAQTTLGLRKRVLQADMIGGSYFLCLHGRKKAMSKVLRDMYFKWARGKHPDMEVEAPEYPPREYSPRSNENEYSSGVGSRGVYTPLQETDSARNRKKPPWRSLTKPTFPMKLDAPIDAQKTFRRTPSTLEAHFASSDDSEDDDAHERTRSTLRLRTGSLAHLKAEAPNTEEPIQELPNLDRRSMLDDKVEETFAAPAALEDSREAELRRQCDRREAELRRQCDGREAELRRQCAQDIEMMQDSLMQRISALSEESVTLGLDKRPPQSLTLSRKEGEESTTQERRTQNSRSSREEAEETTPQGLRSSREEPQDSLILQPSDQCTEDQAENQAPTEISAVEVSKEQPQSNDDSAGLVSPLPPAAHEPAGS